VQDLIRAIEVTRDIIVQQVLKRAHQCHRTPSVQLTKVITLVKLQ
jgi:hypothetical protein